MKRVAIVGGGLAGLSCAWELQRRGIECTVFEAAATPGGRDVAAPFLLSPDLFLNTFKLIEELGLGSDILEISPHVGQVHKRRVYHHRVASATGLLAFRGLNIADKVLLPRMAYLLSRYGSRIDFHHPELGLEFDAETVASFVKRELSQNVLNYVAGPLISTLFFYASEETSNWLYLVLAKYMYNTRMSALRGGMRNLTNRLATNLHIVTGHAVDSIAVDGDSYRIGAAKFSDAVIAIPGDAVLRIRGVRQMLSAADMRFFEQCEYQRVVSVQVKTERPVDGHCYAVSIPRVEKFRASTITFHDYIDPHGHGVLTISGGGPAVTGNELIEDLRRLYSVDSESMEIKEWIHGMPKFPPGRYREIVAFGKRERRPGLFFCGDYLSGPLVEGAITSGYSIPSDLATPRTRPSG